MSSAAVARPRIWHVPAWLARWATHWFAGWFARRPKPTIRTRRGPGHRPVLMRLEVLEAIEGPTGLMANDHLTASLVSFAALHERLPSLTQSQTSSISVSQPNLAVGNPTVLSALGEKVIQANVIAPQSGSFANGNVSPLAPWGRGDGGEGVQSASASVMPWTWQASAFDAIWTGDASAAGLVQDPLALDSVPSTKPSSGSAGGVDSGFPSAPAGVDFGGTPSIGSSPSSSGDSGGGSYWSNAGGGGNLFDSPGIPPVSLGSLPASKSTPPTPASENPTFASPTLPVSVSPPLPVSPSPSGSSPRGNPPDNQPGLSQGMSFLDPGLTATEGGSFQGVVATFYPSGSQNASKYSASISWGDGATSSGTVSGSGGSSGLQVSGSHAYADEGTFSPKVTLQDKAGNSYLLNGYTIQVGDAALAGHGVTLAAQPGVQFADVVGVFTDANPQAKPSDFTASISWGDGASSTGTIAGAGGTFTINGMHDYVASGTYQVSATVQDVGGSSTTLSSTFVVGTSISKFIGILGQDPTVNATEGASFSGSVGTFTDSDGNTNPALYTATITWGDGSGSSSGTVTGSGGANGFTVSGTHTYAEEGSFAVQVSITDTDTSTYTINSTALVADAALTVSNVSTVNATSGNSFTATMATFTDADPNGTVSDYSAVIAWGDGQSSGGTVATNTGGGFKVTGTHIYQNGGSYTATITANDSGGASGSAKTTVSVAGVSGTGVNLSQVVGVGLSATLANFSDSDHNLYSSSYTATITWGDGSSSSGTVSGTGNFMVQGSHTYTQQGYDAITVSITDTDGAKATIQSNINVTNATITGGSSLPSSNSGLSFTGQVAAFVDNDQDTNSGHYSVAINWGDGQTTGPMSVNSVGMGHFYVIGTHNYTAAGTYTVTILVTDLVDSSSSSASSNMTITVTGNLSATGVTGLTATEGTAFSNLVLVTFTDSDNNTNPALYSATITWGDGTANSSGTVTYSGGVFRVAGSHTYAEEGVYPISMTINDTDGASTQAATSITANDAALTTTAMSLTPTAGAPFSNLIVATFSDPDPAGVMTDYTALINWGDNSPPTAGAVNPAMGGGFQVNAGHLYAGTGNYTAVVTITDSGGGQSTASDSVTVSASPWTLTANAVSATEAQSYSGNVASFTPASGHGSDTFVAAIGWGDGGVIYGTVASNGQGGFNISGTHPYADGTNSNNPETLTVTVFDQTTAAVVAHATASVTVADANLSGTGQAVTAWTNQTTGTITVATFTDANTSAPASDFSASIAWGDGNTSGGTIVSNGGGSFSVQGAHTYTTANSFTITTTITDVGGRTAAPTSTATVAASSASVAATEGASFSGVVASFTGNPNNAQSANIVWGDGNSSAGTITSTGQNSFNVSGTHTYAEEGVFNMTVTVQMSVGGPLTASGPAVVADAALTATANAQTGWVGQPLGMVFGQGTGPVTVATFTDADPAGTVSDYTASIAWGDGITSAGVVGLGTGNFKVQSNHTYVQPGSYTITTTIIDAGGVATIVQATATVGIREGQQYQAVLSLALPDAVTTSPPTAYTTTINWGDGNNGSATVTPVYSYATGQLTGSLLVTATHVYAASGSFTISATATNPYTNLSSTGTKSLTVGDALLNGIPQSLSAVKSNSTGTVTVAQFEDTNTSGTTLQFTATIVWGDGSSNSTGTITAVSGTPGLFNVQGSHTYSNTGAYTIQTTINDAGGQSVVVNTPISVVNTWTVLSSLSGGGYAPGSRTSDPDREALQTLGEATVDLNQGALRLSHALDFDQSPGTDVGGNPMLAYNSATVNVRPVIQLEIQSDPNGSNPKATQIAVQLTFNGVQQTTQNFTIGTYTAGVVFLVSVEVASALTATGVYNWSAAVTVTLSNSTQVNLTPSGIAQVVVRDQSNKYGAGWGFGGDALGLAQLYTVSANGNVPSGMLLVTGAGDSRFFTGSGPNYTSPAEDFGALVKNGDNTFTYTTKTQVKYNFNTSGYLTSVVQPSGLQISYGYDGQNRLSTVTTPDGATTTLSYDPTSGNLTGISEPGSRSLSITINASGNLTGITDVDSTTRTLGYDSNHHLTSDQWSPLNASFTFASTGLLTQVNRGLGTTYAITSTASVALTSASIIGSGTALGALTLTPTASVTDGLSHTTQYLLDTRGRLLETIRPDSTTYINQLNSAGDVLVAIDPLARVTANQYNSSGDLTQVTFPDGSVNLYQYQATFHEVTQSTNALGQVSSNTYDSTTGLMTSSTDPLGFVTSYVWSSGRMQSQTDPLGHISLFRYDGDLRQTGMIDALGNWSQTAYAGNGTVSSTTDPIGWVTQTSYNGREELLQTTDANGDVSSQQFNAYGQVTSQTNARGFTMSTTYDQRGFATAQTDYLGNSGSTGYDAAGNVTSQTDPNGNQTSYGFDSDNRQTSVTDALANTISQRQYDAANNLTASTDANSNTMHEYYDVLNREVLKVDPLGNNSFVVYDPTSELLGKINAIGALTLKIYDVDGRQTQMIDPLMHSSQTVFDADANPVQTIDGRGMITRSLFDADNRRTAVIHPNGNIDRITFNPDSFRIQTLDGNGHAASYTLDALNRDVGVSDADGNRWQTVFDVVGNALETVDANGNVTVKTLDADNCVTVTKYPDGFTTKAVYDGAGNMIQWVDQNGKLTQYRYNKDNEQVAAIDPNGNQQTTVWDREQNQLATYDGNQNGTFSGFNANNQPTGTGLATGASSANAYNALGMSNQIADPDGNSSRSLYDQAGNLVAAMDALGRFGFVAYNADNQIVKQVDRDGRTINATYDNDGHLTGQTWIAGDGVTQTNVLSFGFDAAGNLTSAGSNYGSYTITYDLANRALTQTDPFGVTLTLGYDSNGNMTSVQDSLGGTLSSIYDVDNRLTSRRFSDTSNHQLRFDLTYTPISVIASETRYADTAGSNQVGSTTDSYDPAGNVTQIQHFTGTGSSLLKFQYSFDKGNRLSSETDTVNGTPTTTNYSYDTSNQLTTAGSSSYSFDGNGNRTMTGYQTGAENMLLTDGTWNYAFDNEGNVAQKVGVSNNLKWINAYDNMNHLIQATQYSYSGGVWSLSQQVTYQYDVFGNRVEEDVYTASTNTTTVTKFAYNLASAVRQSGSYYTGAANPWSDLNSSNQLLMRRFYLDSVDSVFARMDPSGNAAWYLTDHLGSIRGVMNNSSSLIDQITFDPWGNISSESNSNNGDRYKFAGGEYSSVTGLLHFGARYYDPASGRWISQDPLQFAGGDSNLYRYTSNGPTNRLDPGGTDDEEDNPWVLVKTELKPAGIMVRTHWEEVLGSRKEVPPDSVRVTFVEYRQLGTVQREVETRVRVDPSVRIMALAQAGALLRQARWYIDDASWSAKKAENWTKQACAFLGMAAIWPPLWTILPVVASAIALREAIAFGLLANAGIDLQIADNLTKKAEAILRKVAKGDLPKQTKTFEKGMPSGVVWGPDVKTNQESTSVQLVERGQNWWNCTVQGPPPTGPW